MVPSLSRGPNGPCKLNMPKTRLLVTSNVFFPSVPHFCKCYYLAEILFLQSIYTSLLYLLVSLLCEFYGGRHLCSVRRGIASTQINCLNDCLKCIKQKKTHENVSHDSFEGRIMVLFQSFSILSSFLSSQKKVIKIGMESLVCKHIKLKKIMYTVLFLMVRKKSKQ